MQQTLTSSECPVYGFEGQMHTHMHVHITIYLWVHIYMSPKHPCVLIASQAPPWESSVPLPSQMRENNYPRVTTWEVMAQRREVLQSKAQSSMGEQVTEPGLHQLPSLLLNQVHV